MEQIRAEISCLNNGSASYEVLNILGAGGFGITYYCINRNTGDVCAIKEYMPEAIASRNLRGEIIPNDGRERAFLHGKKRFLEEAEILMRMNNIPAVVHVWESFEENNTAYYVMEYLKGTTLKQVMRSLGGKLPYQVACEAVIKAGMALDTIHRQAGIFHRDISPENIMVMPDGEIKIIDFGSAKSMSISENQQFSVVLKPGFAPPEQYASNLSQGSFTDVYALAGTFYYATSGKMIPVAPDRLMGVTFEPLDKIVPECSRETALAVEHALNLDPKFRTQTMSEFIQGIPKPLDRTSAPVSTGTSAIKEGTTDDYARGNTVTGMTVDGVSTFEKNVMSANVKTEIPIITVGPNEDSTAMIQPEAWIEVVKGACVGKIFPVKANEPVTVGRSSKKSQCVLEGHPEISGLHFRLIYMPQKAGFYLIDESINGLYYQGIRLEKGKKYKVLPGDQVGIGSMECIITVGVG